MESAALAAATERSIRLKAIYGQEDVLAGELDKRDDTASSILAAPASIEGLQLKLEVFRLLWARERGVDQPLDGGDVTDVAAGVALDLLTMICRGEPGDLFRAA